MIKMKIEQSYLKWVADKAVTVLVSFPKLKVITDLVMGNSGLLVGKNISLFFYYR